MMLVDNRLVPMTTNKEVIKEIEQETEMMNQKPMKEEISVRSGREDLDQMTKPQLRDKAVSLGISPKSSWTRSHFIEAIKASESEIDL